MKKKICVITGSRAEYGLLKPLLLRLKKEKDISLQIIATGMHLSKEFGSTYKEIESDGFKITENINIGLNSDDPEGITNSMGKAISGFGRVLGKLKPRFVVVLGDRFEILSAAAAALVHRIPVVHIHGGELTEGAFDDAFRHSITKMSYLHFTSDEKYRKRVIQLGEDPRRVFNVGSLGVDNIINIKLLSKKELEKRLGLEFNKRNLLITFHPVTLETKTSGKQLKALLNVLDKQKDTKLIFTKTNADTDGRIINKLIDEYVKKNPDKAVVFSSMGMLLYLSAMKNVDAVIGNSSSGILEAPSLNVGTIDIGDRQRGRTKPSSVINCKATEKDIEKALNRLFSASFQGSLKKVRSYYGRGKASKTIVSVLKRFMNKEIDLKKSFYDLKINK